VTASAALALEVRRHLHRHQVLLGPVLAAALALAAWAVALLGAATHARPWWTPGWALATTLLGLGYALGARSAAGRDDAPGSALPTALLLAAGAVFGIGAAVLAAAGGPAQGRLVALLALALAAVAMPALPARRALFPAFLALVMLPLPALQLVGPGADHVLAALLLAAAFALGAGQAAALLLAAAFALGAGQAAAARLLDAALRSDAEQRARLSRLEEVNQALSADRVALETESRTDPLTGLANRRYLEQMLHAEWNRCRRAATPLSCVMLDVDHFKAFNDHHGHDGGDACLRRVATLLADSIRRAGDVVARYGGEEFTVLLPDTGRDGAATVAELLKRTVADARIPHARSPIGAHLTVSVGFATLVPNRERHPAELLKAADLALYEAKRRGRDCVVMGDVESLARSRSRSR